MSRTTPSLYELLHASIREMDAEHGRVLERLLQQPQAEFDRVRARVEERLRYLLDPERAPAEVLPSHLALLAFGREHVPALWETLRTEQDARRLLRAAAPYWRGRWTGRGAREALEALTGRAPVVLGSADLFAGALAPGSVGANPDRAALRLFPLYLEPWLLMLLFGDYLMPSGGGGGGGGTSPGTCPDFRVLDFEVVASPAEHASGLHMLRVQTIGNYTARTVYFPRLHVDWSPAGVPQDTAGDFVAYSVPDGNSNVTFLLEAAASFFILRVEDADGNRVHAFARGDRVRRSAIEIAGTADDGQCLVIPKSSVPFVKQAGDGPQFTWLEYYIVGYPGKLRAQLAHDGFVEHDEENWKAWVYPAPGAGTVGPNGFVETAWYFNDPAALAGAWPYQEHYFQHVYFALDGRHASGGRAWLVSYGLDWMLTGPLRVVQGGTTVASRDVFTGGLSGSALYEEPRAFPLAELLGTAALVDGMAVEASLTGLTAPAATYTRVEGPLADVLVGSMWPRVSETNDNFDATAAPAEEGGSGGVNMGDVVSGLWGFLEQYFRAERLEAWGRTPAPYFLPALITHFFRGVLPYWPGAALMYVEQAFRELVRDEGYQAALLMLRRRVLPFVGSKAVGEGRPYDLVRYVLDLVYPREGFCATHYFLYAPPGSNLELMRRFLAAARPLGETYYLHPCWLLDDGVTLRGYWQRTPADAPRATARGVLLPAAEYGAEVALRAEGERDQEWRDYYWTATAAAARRPAPGGGLALEVYAREQARAEVRFEAEHALLRVWTADGALQYALQRKYATGRRCWDPERPYTLTLHAWLDLPEERLMDATPPAPGGLRAPARLNFAAEVDGDAVLRAAFPLGEDALALGGTVGLRARGADFTVWRFRVEPVHLRLPVGPVLPAPAEDPALRSLALTAPPTPGQPVPGYDPRNYRGQHVPGDAGEAYHWQRRPVTPVAIEGTPLEGLLYYEAGWSEEAAQAAPMERYRLLDLFRALQSHPLERPPGAEYWWTVYGRARGAAACRRLAVEYLPPAALERDGARCVEFRGLGPETPGEEGEFYHLAAQLRTRYALDLRAGAVDYIAAFENPLRAGSRATASARLALFPFSSSTCSGITNRSAAYGLAFRLTFDLAWVVAAEGLGSPPPDALAMAEVVYVPAGGEPFRFSSQLAGDDADADALRLDAGARLWLTRAVLPAVDRLPELALRLRLTPGGSLELYFPKYLRETSDAVAEDLGGGDWTLIHTWLPGGEAPTLLPAHEVSEEDLASLATGLFAVGADGPGAAAAEEYVLRLTRAEVRVRDRQIPLMDGAPNERAPDFYLRPLPTARTEGFEQYAGGRLDAPLTRAALQWAFAPTAAGWEAAAGVFYAGGARALRYAQRSAGAAAYVAGSLDPARADVDLRVWLGSARRGTARPGSAAGLCARVQSSEPPPPAPADVAAGAVLYLWHDAATGRETLRLYYRAPGGAWEYAETVDLRALTAAVGREARVRRGLCHVRLRAQDNYLRAYLDVGATAEHWLLVLERADVPLAALPGRYGLAVRGTGAGATAELDTWLDEFEVYYVDSEELPLPGA